MRRDLAVEHALMDARPVPAQAGEGASACVWSKLVGPKVVIGHFGHIPTPLISRRIRRLAMLPHHILQQPAVVGLVDDGTRH